MSTQEPSWRDAALEVLDDADEPLHYNEITLLIGEKGIRQLSGKSPARTVNRELNLLVQASTVVATGSGYYALPQTAQRSQEAAAAEDEAAEEAADDPQRLTVKAYGLHWDRTLVDWSPTKGQLWGQRDDNSSPVNFADQDGIYLLHSWNEIVYVGQTLTRKGDAGLYNRLRSHHADRDKRKSDRWDTFSWFGFKAVDERMNLLAAPPAGDLASVIDVVEAMFIEALMPRLNMQSGRGSKALRDTGLYFQSSFQRASRGFR